MKSEERLCSFNNNDFRFSFLQPVSAAEMAAEQLKKEVVTSGDGLYADPTVPGRYVFKGANPQ